MNENIEYPLFLTYEQQDLLLTILNRYDGYLPEIDSMSPTPFSEEEKGILKELMLKVYNNLGLFKFKD